MAIGEGVRLHVREPWFGEIAAGRKTVEGRVGPLSLYRTLEGGRVILHGGARAVRATVVAVRHYDSLDEYLAGEGWERTAPHAGSLAAATEAHLAVRRGYGEQVFAPDRIRLAGGISAIVLKFL